VQELTDFPELLGGRVKTLHPAIHAAILARREHPGDLAELEQHGFTPIDIVVANLYPFIQTIQDPETTREIALETIDIGGGLGFDYQHGRGPAPADLAARVLPVVAPLGLQVLLEPGRAIVGSAGVLLTHIEYLKLDKEKRFAVVDASMSELIRPALYGAWHDIVPVEERGDAAETYDVVGPVCESSDVLGTERSLAVRA